ncbi:MAG: carboxypeptidase regulatory-like domain-containing protein, partial [Bryobacteraceae bacterium]
IPGASVTITEQDKRSAFQTRTGAEGRFVFPNLLPGRYGLTVEAAGFRKAEQRDINLLANDKITVGTIRLDVGTVTETVEVVGQGTQLKSESSERSEAIIGAQLQNIAVNSRSYLQLAGIAPGVVSTANLTTGGVGGLANISANGARFDHNNLTLDGIGNVDTGANGSQMASLSLDSVQEFQILTSNYQAEFGRSSGAQISVVTRSGARDFHGSAYLYHRHEGLNANNWRNNRDNLPRNLFRYNDPGYTIGGPIFIPGKFNSNREKLFFFVSQEFQEQLRPQNRRDATFPTDLERTGDFSQSIDRNNNRFPYIRDPLAGRPCSANDVTGCFNNGALGRIPPSRLYAPGVAVLNFFPKPNAISPQNVGFNFRSQLPDSYP